MLCLLKKILMVLLHKKSVDAFIFLPSLCVRTIPDTHTLPRVDRLA